ncbi:hypothetical protein QBC42DRAFT_230528 [Cladorrhinum samala]|uniref:HNH nuclease domain-containing protein n=1 Tax=Cladorrhinum samala TaxID=585594 RepID=A0AAV9HHY5_9PEZI|nr:hypothetical protein QBC42DRAFT_230528 [Cladorrhinum samala]
MTAKRLKTAEYEPQPIEVKFVFNRPIGWMPSRPAGLPRDGSDPSPTRRPADVRNVDDASLDHGAQPSASRFPTTDEELKEQFAVFIRREIVSLITNKSNELDDDEQTMSTVERVKILAAIRAVALDPSSRFFNLNLPNARRSLPLDKYFKLLLKSIFFQAANVIGIWVDKPVKTLDAMFLKEEAEGGEETSTKGKAADQGRADKAAQRRVPPWYQNCCCLTGTETVDAAHIIDVQAAKSMRDPLDFWGTLQLLWPLDDIQQLEIAGHEERNILPLQPTAHRLWDRHKFALRPIPHPTDPEHKVYLQVVWFDDRHAEIGLTGNNGQGSSSKETDLLDRRRKMEDSIGSGARYVLHGDVYELSTSDPENRPLPDVCFLEMRYAVQQLLACQQAAGALRAIFGGDPPEDPGTTRDEAFMPSDWDGMLREALELGILSTKKEEIWRRCILERAYVKGLQKVWKYRKWKADLKRGPEEEEEDEGTDEEEE